jgi:PD-(D/E)XK nuclease superfamily
MSISYQGAEGYQPDKARNPLQQPADPPKESTMMTAANNADLQELQSLEKKLDLLASRRRRIDRELAPEFNVVEYITHETSWSDVLADFLDPAGRHGQGDLFLNEFLRIVALRLPKSSAARATLSTIRLHSYVRDTNPWRLAPPFREAPTIAANNKNRKRRRIDITLPTSSFRFAIGIENKPWPSSEERPDQVSDYSDDLAAQFGDNNYLIVYLSRSGGRPASLDAGKRATLMDHGQLVLMSYKEDVLEWLRACRNKCQADRVRDFITDWIDRLTGHRRSKPLPLGAEVNPLLKYFRASPDEAPIAGPARDAVLRYATLCPRAAKDICDKPAVRHYIVSQFMQDLAQRIAQQIDGWDARHEQGTEVSRVRIYKKGQEDLLYVALGKKRRTQKPAYITVRPPERGGQLSPEGAERVKSHLGARLGKSKKPKREKLGSRAYWWETPARRYSDWCDPDVLLRLSMKEEATAYVTERLKLV